MMILEQGVKMLSHLKYMNNLNQNFEASYKLQWKFFTDFDQYSLSLQKIGKYTQIQQL